MNDSVTLILGKSWTGKTARMLHELRDQSRLILADPKCSQLSELSGWSHFWPNYLDGKQRWNAEEAVVLLKLFQKRLLLPFRVMVHFRSYFRENLNLLSLLALGVKRLTFAVDELALFAPPGPPQALPEFLTSVIVSGSHDGVRFVGTAQRPASVHKTIFAVCNRMLVYRVTEANDLDFLRGYLPDDLLQQVPSLPDQVCVDWADGRPAFVDYSYREKLGSVLPEKRISGISV